MSRLLSSALALRRDPRMLKLPPYLSLLCLLIGLLWLLLLPLDNYSRRTYISENALLPGQVHTYFGGSEHHVLRAYQKEVDALEDGGVNDKIEEILTGFGVKVGRQTFRYEVAGEVVEGENIYGILQAPRGDATEAIVLVAPWKSIGGEANRNGVALALTLARYFKRWSLWSKDIILLFPADSRAGTQAWVDAYHDSHNPAHISPLPLKSGALQGALALDFPLEHKFGSLHIIYDGTNGQLPNLDLVNSIGNVAGGQMGIHSFIQGNPSHNGRYTQRLQTMMRGMLTQGLGRASGAHSCFIPYHVDAVTLQPYGLGPHDEMAMGRVIEGSFRSLNNLLEHLHQSFFFYLLMQRERFVSIGTYLPSAMLLAANFSIMAIFVWVKSGHGVASKSKEGGKKGSLPVVERNLVVPVSVVAGCHALASVPLFIFNHLPASILPTAFTIFTTASALLPFLISNILNPSATIQTYQLTKSFSLLFLGMALSTLATLNFSLAFIVGLLAAPLSFIQPVKNAALRYSLAGGLSCLAPPMVVWTASQVAGLGIGEVLREASFGWNVWGMYTSLVVWGVWWPAWVVGMVNVLGVVV